MMIFHSYLLNNLRIKKGQLCSYIAHLPTNQGKGYVWPHGIAIVLNYFVTCFSHWVVFTCKTHNFLMFIYSKLYLIWSLFQKVLRNFKSFCYGFIKAFYQHGFHFIHNCRRFSASIHTHIHNIFITWNAMYVTIYIHMCVCIIYMILKRVALHA